MESDKVYWHRYWPEYERLVFSQLPSPKTIVEFGVLNGASISLLHKRFPRAAIVGVDLMNKQDIWPVGLGISYLQLDQGDRERVNNLLNHLMPNLIIDDGSHKPEHQALCLVAGIRYLHFGGFYILEDIQGSHPDNPKRPVRKINCFNLLLILQNLKELNKELNEPLRSMLSVDSYFSREEIEMLSRKVESVHLYRRTALPLRCYSCGGNDFDYVNLLCPCGNINLFSEWDSMAFMIKVH